jgi:flagellin
MLISTRNNSTATSALQSVNQSQDPLKRALQQVATGLRINRAADDAAGLAIATQMSAQLSGLVQAGRNARDASSMLQVAEGGLSEVSNALQRMRDLAIQASSDTNGPSERAALQKEVDQLQSEITRVTGAAEFNGRKLLDGSLQGARFQVGPQAGDELNVSVAGVSVPSVDLSTQAGASSAVTALDAALQNMSEQRASVGALQNRIDATVRDLASAAENTLQARSRIEDANMAQATAERARNDILSRSAIAVLAQANAMPQVAVALLR